MRSCISDVEALTTVNMLKLNDNKTELILVTSIELSITITYLLQSQSAMLNFPCEEFGSCIRLSSMNAHVSNIAQMCYFELSH